MPTKQESYSKIRMNYGLLTMVTPVCVIWLHKPEFYLTNLNKKVNMLKVNHRW